jgi:hypothetical protein
MYDLYETETYINHHSEELMQKAEHEREMSWVKRVQNRRESEYFDMFFRFGFIRTPDSRFGQIVIEGELK